MLFSSKRFAVIDKIIIIAIIGQIIILTFLINKYNTVDNSLSLTEQSYVFSGDGTYSNPYLISDGEDLKKLSELVNSGNTFSNQYFQLTEDIDMTGIEMDPIGVYGEGNYFYGTLDGNGHCLKNLVINTDEGYDGLFGKLGGTVMNLGIESGFIGNDSYQGSCGAIASHAASSSARIINCYNKATVGGYRAGGIADNFAGSIINCWTDCRLVGVEIGGITSYYSSSGLQTFCYSTVGLTGDGTGAWFECKNLTVDELYSKAMADRLSANCLIWFETMTPVKQLNGWTFDGGLSFSNNKTTYSNIINLFWLFVYATSYYSKIMLMSVLLVVELIVIFVIQRIKTINEKKNKLV